LVVPEQTEILPVIEHVGIGSTVITAEPLPVPVQLISLTAVRVYVVVTAGETMKVYGDDKILFTVVGVMPFV